MRLYQRWMRLVYLLGTINGYLILTLFYVVILGFYALGYRIARLFDRGGGERTYWRVKSPREPLEKELLRQF